jgi:hypothetical protein
VVPGKKILALALALGLTGAAALIFGLTQIGATSTVGQDTIVNKANPQSIPNRVATLVTWDKLREDTLGAFTQSDPSHIRIPDPGMYLVTVQAGWKDCTCGYRSVHLQIDGGGIVAGQPLPAKWETGESISWQGRLNAGQTLSVWVYQDSGGPLNFGGYNRPSGVSANNELAISRIG